VTAQSWLAVLQASNSSSWCHLVEQHQQASDQGHSFAMPASRVAAERSHLAAPLRGLLLAGP
jgi:hypothetical protein